MAEPERRGVTLTPSPAAVAQQQAAPAAGENREDGRGSRERETTNRGREVGEGDLNIVGGGGGKHWLVGGSARICY